MAAPAKRIFYGDSLVDFFNLIRILNVYQCQSWFQLSKISPASEGAMEWVHNPLCHNNVTEEEEESVFFALKLEKCHQSADKSPFNTFLVAEKSRFLVHYSIKFCVKYSFLEL